MFCQNCGHKAENDAKFCPHCGFELIKNNTSLVVPTNSHFLHRLLQKLQQKLKKFWKNFDNTYNHTVYSFNTGYLPEHHSAHSSFINATDCMHFCLNHS